MAQFNINWFNTAIILNPSSEEVRVLHRQKSVGGDYSYIGYTPANDLPKTASTSQSPILANNIVWEFRVETQCGEGLTTPNDNGNQEGLKFACLTPSISETETTATIVLNVTGLDITSGTFTLRKVSDDSVVSGPTTVARVGIAITHTATGLIAATGYYWDYVVYAIVNGSQIQSNSINQLNSSCFSIDFTTDLLLCAPCTAITISVIET